MTDSFSGCVDRTLGRLNACQRTLRCPRTSGLAAGCDQWPRFPMHAVSKQPCDRSLLEKSYSSCMPPSPPPTHTHTPPILSPLLHSIMSTGPTTGPTRLVQSSPPTPLSHLLEIMIVFLDNPSFDLAHHPPQSFIFGDLSPRPAGTPHAHPPCSTSTFAPLRLQGIFKKECSTDFLVCVKFRPMIKFIHETAT
jgi:hypothetical protein